MCTRAATDRRAALALLVIAAACRPTEELPRDEVLAWLTCMDCIDGEAADVVGLGEEAVPELRRALDGPPAMLADSVRARSLHDWERTARFSISEGQPVPMGRDEFLDEEVERFATAYRMRAADALGRIGGSRARAALLGATADGERDPAFPPLLLRALIRAVARTDGG